ncbi:MAG: stalk domain-containing protein [Defluviitaleaceae bacterium]|nr:stalk domain-containing protein [Defluviitaleaceae bacterium]
MKKSKKHGNIKKLIAMLLVVVIVIAIVPTQATQVRGAELSLIFAPGDPVEFERGHFPASYEAAVGDTGLIFYINVTVASPSGLTVGSGIGISSNPISGMALGVASSAVVASAPTSFTLWWYQDGVRRADMGNIAVGAGLGSTRGELRFDTVWATDNGVWTLRAYDGLDFVESLYSLDLIISPLGIMPLTPPVFDIGTGTWSDGAPPANSHNTTWDGTILFVQDSANIGVTGTSNAARHIIVGANATANITINDLTITLFASSPLQLNSGSNLTLNIEGVNTLAAMGGQNAGIRVNHDATLIVEGTTGSLTATGNITGAGIGGNGLIGGAGGNNGTVIINGGTINATGGDSSGAGIGGGRGDYPNGGSGGTITINGGTVNATGGAGSGPTAGGAGLGGGGNGGAGGNITINAPAIVNAIGTWNAAGIGGGGGGDSGTINISGGTVTAGSQYGPSIGAGIDGGGGSGGTINTITVTGGDFVVMDSNQLTDTLIAIGAGTATIQAGADFDITSPVVIPNGANITLTSSSSGPHTLTRDVIGPLFDVDGSTTSLTLSNITIDGASGNFPDAAGALVNVWGGNLTMNSGTTLQNNSRALGSGGGVFVGNGGTFTMHGGEISNNSTGANGGGVALGVSGSNGGTFHMNGGTISGNTANSGGGVWIVHTSSSFTLNNGVIHSNTAVAGGGITILDGIGTMSDGAVSGNTTTSATPSDNVTIDVGPGGIFHLNGGVVQCIGVSIVNVIRGTFNHNLGGSDNGIVIAWNGTTSATHVTGSATDLVVSPTGSASWGLSGSTSGISYNYNGNTGFIPVSGVTVTGATSITSGAITVTTPARNASVASTAATLANTTASAITWTHGSGTAAGANFGPSRVYTAEFTLTTSTGFDFNGLAADTLTVIGATSVIHSAVTTGTTVTVTAVFPATAAAPPPSGGTTTPPTGDTHDTTENQTPRPSPSPSPTSRPTPTPGPALPNVRVELSQGLTSELQTLLGDSFNDLNINIETSASASTSSFVIADISFSVANHSLNNTLTSQLPSILQAPDAYYTIHADLLGFVDGGVNHHRIVAFHDDTIIGGGISSRNMVFSVNTRNLGEFTVSYVANLRRLVLSLDSFTITDLAGNVPDHTMDIRPIILNNRALVPLRFIAEVLGAEVDWTNATSGRPLTVHLNLNGQTLNIPIGEITPQLSSLGMDVPAQIIDGRTMVPLRFISEFFGAVVTWDGDTRGIEIIS